MYKQTKFIIFKVVFGVLVLVQFVSCLPKQQLPQTSKDNPAKATVPPLDHQRPVSVAPAGLAYIERFSAISVEEMNRHGIPASIKLAQGLLESGNGKSRLAVEANNHFGIKCTSDWTGKRISHHDDALDECFRVYSDPEQSFRDHSTFLLRKRYEDLFRLDKNDYKAWARGLKAAGYATNPRYAELLIDLIERYELYKFDTLIPQAARELEVVTPAKVAEQMPPTDLGSRKQAMQIHEVKNGETITQIAEKYGITSEQIKVWNQLVNLDLQPGQLLVVNK